MKLYQIAAAAMLFAGGSALAYAPAPDMSKDDLATVVDKGAQAAAFKMDDKAPKATPAAFLAEDEPMLVPAAAVTWDDADPMDEGDPDLDLSETSIDETIPPEPVVSDLADTQPAVGGPLEEVAAADLTPRPASQNYPPCRAGPGDDNCIQLYEPGVRTALASWTAPTGGLGEQGEAMAAATTTTESLNAESLAMASAQVEAIQADGTALASAETDTQAVGGPYEPVDEAEAEQLAMNGDGTVDEEMGETEDFEEV
jgi:hypothetical protein